MTCMVSLKLIEEMKINISTVFVTITSEVTSVKGTKANLKEGDQLSVQDLLYALMLPSGNDAALALSFNFGLYLFVKHCKNNPE